MYKNMQKGVNMEEHPEPKMTTIKVRKETIELLKIISRKRGRRESMDQTIMVLLDTINKFGGANE